MNNLFVIIKDQKTLNNNLYKDCMKDVDIPSEIFCNVHGSKSCLI